MERKDIAFFDINNEMFENVSKSSIFMRFRLAEME